MGEMPSQTGSPAGGERVRDDHVRTGPHVGLVHGLDQLGAFQIGPAAPRVVVHRRAGRLQLGTGAAVHDDDLAVREAPEDLLCRPHSCRLLACGAALSARNSIVAEMIYAVAAGPSGHAQPGCASARSACRA
jgi:hypothetical protein